MLRASAEQYRQQQRITALGLREARRRASGGSVAVARTVGTYQAASVALAVSSAPDILSEQGIGTASEALVNTAALLTGGSVAGMVDAADTQDAFDLLVVSLIQDAARTGSLVDAATRPAVTGYVRYLNPPSCGRCAVLAGRVYRYSQGFQRHPRCDCQMNPTNEKVGPNLVRDPIQAFRNGQIRGLSKGDTEALNAGADLGQVVNVRRRQSGLVEGSSVMVRAGRPTPQFISRVASDRAEQLELLRRYGYVI